jgi:starch phosphorylase
MKFPFRDPVCGMEVRGDPVPSAMHNGVPSLSVLDGWWIEGHIDGVTGWSIDGSPETTATPDEDAARDAVDLYQKLRTVVVPTFYRAHSRWIEIMRQSIAFNASFFNSHRMVQQYAANAYVSDV